MCGILQFMAEHNDIELVHTALRPLLLMLADYRNLNVNLLRVTEHLLCCYIVISCHCSGCLV